MPCPFYRSQNVLCRLDSSKMTHGLKLTWYQCEYLHYFWIRYIGEYCHVIIPQNLGAILASSVASFQRSANIARQFLRMMIVFTDTSYPELTYSLNASSTYFIISDCNNPSFVGDGYCDDDTNNNDCEFDKGDCCGSLILTQYCHFCECIQYSTPSWTTTANISNFYQLIVAKLIKADSHLPTFQQIKILSTAK